MTRSITLEVCQEAGGKEMHREVFPSLEEAVSKSRQYPPQVSRTLRLGQGQYFLEHALVLDSRDEGLTIMADPGTAPELIGGRLLQHWQPEGEKCWSVDLPAVREGSWDFRSLVVNGRFAKRSRFPASGFFQNRNEWSVPWMSTTGGGWQRKPTAEELTTMVYDPKDLGPWLDVRNAELTVYHKWDESVVGVAALDDKAHRLTFRNPASHPPGAFGVHKYVVWNIREGMTEPGQWYLDRTRGKLVYWPLAGESMKTAEAIAPVTESIIRVEGTRERPVRRLTLQGLTLSVANTPLKAGGFGAGKFDGALQVHVAHDSLISGLTIVNVGGQAIKEQGSAGLTIEGCHIHHVGACGIMFGDGAKTIRNNHIHNIGVLYPSAIALSGGGKEAPGSLIAHNEIHDVPYTGIACGGAGHRIESNLIYRAMREMDDGAAIYISMCQDITLRGNYVHDIAAAPDGSKASAYYLDEQAERCLVESNLAVNVAFPSHNHMAKANTIRRNVFLSTGDMVLTFVKCADYRMEENILQADGAITLKYSESVRDMSRNVIFSRTGKVMGAREGNSLESPGVRCDDRGHMVFATGSAAERLGIQPLDVSRGRHQRGALCPSIGFTPV